jgi:glyceraldehyde 3-phosphate dehydrogenase
MAIKVAINGFGRIGRAFFRLTQEHKEIHIVAVNDLGDVKNLAYLLAYDSVYGKNKAVISSNEGALVVNGKEVPFLSEKDPLKLPWKKLGVDVVLESTGVFASYEKAKVHLDAGAKRVVISAPVEDTPPPGVNGATVLIGVNEEQFKTCDISSNASCTTNAGSPLIAILHEAIGIEKALLNTVHGYTASQSLVDSPVRGSDYRRGRAAAHNIIPSTTGAATAVTKAFTELDGLFDGIAMRVPVVAGSIADITFLAKRDTTVEEVNDVLRAAAKTDRWKKVFAVTDEQLVSSDILGEPHASIADLSFTRVVGGNLVKVLAWYDNELGYTNSLVEHVVATGRYATAK